jgi:hypothetical protein
VARQLYSARYELPSPRCRHVIRPGRPRTMVSSHASYADAPPSHAFASTWVCGREACIEDAKAWVWASTHQEPVITRKDHPSDDTPAAPAD